MVRVQMVVRLGTFKVSIAIYHRTKNPDGTLHPDAIQNVRIQLTVTDGEDTLTEFEHRRGAAAAAGKAHL